MTDKKPAPKLNISTLFLIGGLVFLFADILFVLSGEIDLKMENQIDHKVVSMVDSPLEFWSLVTIAGLVSVFFLWASFKSKGTDSEPFED